MLKPSRRQRKKRGAERQILDAKLPLLNPAETELYRSNVMRGSYLSQDRPDLSDTIKGLARDMKTPNEGSMQRLKRLGK